MSYENTSGRNVHTQYGTRTTGGAVGNDHSQSSIQTVTYHLTGEMLNSTFDVPVYVPKGALLLKAFLNVDEVFVVSTSGTVAIGGTAPGTDGIVLTEAKLEATGVSDVTALSIGTWAEDGTGTTAAQKITKSITGTVGATSGKAQLVMQWVVRDKV